MDFFSSSRGKKDGKRSGLFGKKSASKSNPASPPRHSHGNKSAETENHFPISYEQTTYRKQPASEHVPNSHPRPPVYGFGTPERRRGHGRERMEALNYESETNAPSSPFHPSGNRTVLLTVSELEFLYPKQQQSQSFMVRGHSLINLPDISFELQPERRTKPREYTGEHQYRMSEADTRSNASPFHPFKSPSPSPYQTPDRHQDHDIDHYAAMYEPEPNTILQTSAPASPFHPARSRSPSPYRTPDRPSNYGNEQFEDLYERDGNVTPRNSSPPSPFHPAASRSPPPQSYRTPDRSRNHHGNEQYETMYEADGDVMPRNSAPPSPVHGGAQSFPFYSSSEEDNHSTYLFPEIATPARSMPVSANSTPVHQNYQIVVAENYELDKQYEPPELLDESQSFTLQEIAKMRGFKCYETGKEKEESQSMISEAYVSVAKYRVRLSVAESLQAILDKHGDIAGASKLQSIVTRSYYLESLAAIVMELRSTELRDLTKKRVAEMAAEVKDMEAVKIDVSWLKKSMAELEEAVQYYGEYEAKKAEREECERELKAVKGEMDEMRAELGKREEEIKESRERVTVLAGKLGQLEMKGSRLNKNLELFQSKVHKFQGEAVLLQV